MFRWERDQKEVSNHHPEAEENSVPRILYEDSTKEFLIMNLAEGHKSAALWFDEARVILWVQG